MLLPHLKEVLGQSFPDPTTITGAARDAQWRYECMVASVFKKVIAELIGWGDAWIEEAKHLELKRKGEVKESFGIGRESE